MPTLNKKSIPPGYRELSFGEIIAPGDRLSPKGIGDWKPVKGCRGSKYKQNDILNIESIVIRPISVETAPALPEWKPVIPGDYYVRGVGNTAQNRQRCLDIRKKYLSDYAFNTQPGNDFYFVQSCGKYANFYDESYGAARNQSSFKNAKFISANEFFDMFTNPKELKNRFVLSLNMNLCESV